ncbi:MAG: phosphodiesterase [Nitrospinota bacterium]|nr:MAG: phosphodiesterase [Nitrospinota bacterium]
MRKVLVIGLDCAAPEFIFDQWRSELPHLQRLIEQGLHGPLTSCIPPITVPAWSVMMTSKNPGRLGVYGFRNRADYSYSRLTFATSQAIKEPTVWDLLSRQGRQVIVVSVPQTYPPKPVNGCLLSCFLTPDTTTSQYTYPPTLKQEIDNLVGKYLVDVENFRSEDKDDILRQIYEMTERRFRVVRHLLTTRPWDFAIFVEMGVDRIHHGFWKYTDPRHRKYEPGNPYEQAIKDYYIYIDQEIGRLLSLLDDDTVVLVVSDHGAKRMDGGICINEWLIQEGYLTLKEYPATPTPLSKLSIDWSRTRAWGEGGYYARLFLNVKGREPEGTIDPAQYEQVRDELRARLEALTDEQGNNIGTRVFKPEEVYPVVNGIAPDLIVYFGNLYWRSVGIVGLRSVHTFENDTGPDDANHAEQGIFILYDPRRKEGRWREDMTIYDVAPTILHHLGMAIPGDMEGKVLE